MALYTVPGMPVSIEAPDGLNDQQVNSLRQDATTRYMKETEAASSARPNGWVGNVAQLLSSGGVSGFPGMNAAPESSVSKINPKSFIGMTAEQSNATLNRLHQSDNDALREHMQQKAMTQQSLEREKDRSQDIKLQQQKFKNDTAMQQHQEAVQQETERRQLQQAEQQAKKASEIRMDEAKQKEELPTAKARREVMSAQAERYKKMPAGGSRGYKPSFQTFNGKTYQNDGSGNLTPVNLPPDPKELRKYVDESVKRIKESAIESGVASKLTFDNKLRIPDKKKYDTFISDRIHEALSDSNTTDDEWVALLQSPQLKSLGAKVDRTDQGIRVTYPDGRAANFTGDNPEGVFEGQDVADSGEPGQMIDIGLWNGMRVQQDPKTGEYYGVGLK